MTAQRRHSRHSCTCQLIRNFCATWFHRCPPSRPPCLPEAHPQHADERNNDRAILSQSQAPKRARDVWSGLGSRLHAWSTPLYSRPWRGSLLPYCTIPRRQTRTACSTLISSHLFVSTRPMSPHTPPRPASVRRYHEKAATPPCDCVRLSGKQPAVSASG